MEGHVPESTKNERADIIKEISIKKFKTFLDSNIGSETEVLIEKRLDKKTGMFKGLTRNYINVLLPDGSFNELVKVKLNNIQDNKFFGELIR